MPGWWNWYRRRVRLRARRQYLLARAIRRRRALSPVADRTGDIGAFVALGDSASSSGVRRIEALTGQAALDHLRQQDVRLAAIASALKAPSAEVVDRVKALMDERRALQNEVAQLRRQVAMGGPTAAPATRDVRGIHVHDVDGSTALMELVAEGADQAVLREAVARGTVREFTRVVPPLSEIYREVTA